MWETMGEPARDARPFVAHHLRRRADARDVSDPEAVHVVARWVENLPAGNKNMATIEATGALGYEDGSFDGGPEAEELITACRLGADVEAREDWLGRFAEAVYRYWS